MENPSQLGNYTSYIKAMIWPPPSDCIDCNWQDTSLGWNVTECLGRYYLVKSRVEGLSEDPSIARLTQWHGIDVYKRQSL